MSPPAPLTIRRARRDGALYLWIACRPCSTGRVVEFSAIPERFDQDTVRDLHLRGAFRCASCATPAIATMVITRSPFAAQTQVERWATPP